MVVGVKTRCLPQAASRPPYQQELKYVSPVAPETSLEGPRRSKLHCQGAAILILIAILVVCINKLGSQP